MRNTFKPIYIRIGFRSCSTLTVLDNRLILWSIHKTFLMVRDCVLRCKFKLIHLRISILPSSTTICFDNGLQLFYLRIGVNVHSNRLKQLGPITITLLGRRRHWKLLYNEEVQTSAATARWGMGGSNERVVKLWSYHPNWESYRLLVTNLWVAWRISSQAS